MGSTVSRRSTILFAVCLVVLLGGLLTLNAFRLSSLSPTSLEQTLLFFSLSTVSFLLCITVFVLLVRNILRLYAEQSGNRCKRRKLVGELQFDCSDVQHQRNDQWDWWKRSDR